MLSPSSPAAEGREVPRTALLERLANARARIVLLSAPAGFGKTTLALQFARQSPAFALCDCADLSSEVELATRLVAALARESNGVNAGFLMQCQLALGTPTVPLNERLALAVEAWRNTKNEATFVLENAEALAGDRDAIRFVTHLMSTMPEARRLIVCSRTSLPIRFGRFAAPERLLTLRADDLAFTSSELSGVFALAGVPSELAERAGTLTRGWPIVAMLLARVAREGRLSEVLDRLGSVGFDDLHGYLADQVLDELDEDVTNALAVCAFVPAARRDEVAAAIGDPQAMDAFERFARDSPLVSLANETYELHPLIRATFASRYQERGAPALRAVADYAESMGNEIRSAELHLRRGDQETAAAVLDRIDWIERPCFSIDAARVFAAFDRAVIRRYPRLWAITVLYGRFSFDPHLAIGEAYALLRTMDERTPVTTRSYVVRPLAGFLSRRGMHDVGYRMIRDFEDATQVPAIPQNFDQAAVIYIRAMIAGRMGRLAEFREQFARAWPFAATNDTMRALLLIERAGEVERALGQRASERASLQEALAAARRTTVSTNVACALAESSFGAWLAGERETYEASLDELEDVVMQESVRGFQFFVDCARGRLDRTPSGSELPKWLACGNLILSAASSGEERVRRANAAVDGATQYGAPFTQTLAWLALGELVTERRREAFEQAMRCAQRVESSALADAVAAFVSGDSDCGMLDGFAGRVRASAPAERSRLEIHLLDATVRLNDRAVELSDRKLELVLALARHRVPTPREDLEELLWPDLNDDSRRNAFNVCLHHVRQRLPDGIVRSPNGYAIVPGTRVDLWEAESFIADVRLRRQLGDLERTALERWYRRLGTPRPNRVSRWEWFEATERRIEELRCEAAQYLAREALAGGRPLDALDLARVITAYDPCDELACEIAVRAQLTAGDRAAAIREYRRYAEVLERELQARPSFTFESLVSA